MILLRDVTAYTVGDDRFDTPYTTIPGGRRVTRYHAALTASRATGIPIRAEGAESVWDPEARGWITDAGAPS